MYLRHPGLYLEEAVWLHTSGWGQSKGISSPVSVMILKKKPVDDSTGFRVGGHTCPNSYTSSSLSTPSGKNETEQTTTHQKQNRRLRGTCAGKVDTQGAKSISLQLSLSR
jgi:hypothetical protein